MASLLARAETTLRTVAAFERPSIVKEHIHMSQARKKNEYAFKLTAFRAKGLELNALTFEIS